MASPSMPLPPGAKLIQSDAGPALPPGAKLVSGGPPATQSAPQYHSKLPWPLSKVDEAVDDSVNAMAAGLMRALHGKDTDERLGGVSQVLHGFANSAGVPLAIEAGVAAPLRTALGLGTGIAAQKGASKAAEAMGAGPGTSEFTGDVAGVLAGSAASREGAPTAIKGAAKGAVQAATETVPLKKLGVDINLPKPLVTGAATAAALGPFGVPHQVGATIGAAAPIVRGAFQGAKAALAERLAKAVESMKSAEGLTAEQQTMVDAASKAPTSRVLSPDDADAIFGAGGEAPAAPVQSAPAQPQPVPGQKFLPVAPQVTQMPAAPDASFVRAVPAQYPEVAPINGPQAAPPQPPRTLAQTEAAMAQKGAPPLEAPRSQYTASGELKSPQLRGAEKEAANRTAKAQRFAKALHEAGVESADAVKIESGVLADSQMQQGAMPRWGNIAAQLGEKDPSALSIPEIIKGLRELEKAKATPAKTAEAAQPAAKPIGKMTRSEIAAKAGLPENATTEQIMQALAKEMGK